MLLTLTRGISAEPEVLGSVCSRPDVTRRAGEEMCLDMEEELQDFLVRLFVAVFVKKLAFKTDLLEIGAVCKVLRAT